MADRQQVFVLFRRALVPRIGSTVVPQESGRPSYAPRGVPSVHPRVVCRHYRSPAGREFRDKALV